MVGILPLKRPVGALSGFFYTDVLLSEFSLSYGFDSEPSTLFDTFAITLSWLDAESWYYVIGSH
jgi:hypothetical protein